MRSIDFFIPVDDNLFWLLMITNSPQWTWVFSSHTSTKVDHQVITILDQGFPWLQMITLRLKLTMRWLLLWAKVFLDYRWSHLDCLPATAPCLGADWTGEAPLRNSSHRMKLTLTVVLVISWNLAKRKEQKNKSCKTCPLATNHINDGILEIPNIGNTTLGQFLSVLMIHNRNTKMPSTPPPQSMRHFVVNMIWLVQDLLQDRLIEHDLIE